MMTTETIFGGGATAAITFQHPMVLKNVLGANIRVIPGYPGTREVNLALHRGEVNGTCGLYVSTIKASFADEVSSGQLKPGDPDGQQALAGIRRRSERVRLRQKRHGPRGARRAFQAAAARWPSGLAGPPGIPPDPPEGACATAALTATTMKDVDFRAEADKVGLEIDPASAAEVDALLKRYAAYPPEIFRKAQEAIRTVSARPFFRRAHASCDGCHGRG